MDDPAGLPRSLLRTGVYMKLYVAPTLLLVSAILTGCQQRIIDHADDSVYRLIEDRQRTALGVASDVGIGMETGDWAANDRMYELAPRPLQTGVPEAFQQRRVVPQSSTPDREERAAGDQRAELDSSLTSKVSSEPGMDEVAVFGLRDALAYAMRHSRRLQNAKEDLYRAALDLTLERHLWTPQLVASVQADFDSSDTSERDTEASALSLIGDVAVSQRLPYGGEVAAQVISSLVRDLEERVTSGESGNLILQANIPLLRGAGRVAREARYNAERQLIYAVRNYERFRRSFLVEVAADYFNLQQLKASIGNTYNAYESRKLDWEKADFINRMGQSRSIFEAPRAKSSLRAAEAALVSAKEQYESALDRFKVFIGMPVEGLLDVLEQNLDDDSAALDELLPDVDEVTAIDVALRYRLDLLNSADVVDDALRGTVVARNQVLPDLNFGASLTLDTDPNHVNAFNFHGERHAWNAGLELRLDDRKAERNAYRGSLISLRRAERDHDESADNVRADVRRALRRVTQQENLRLIQALNVEENQLRLEAARAQFDLGKSTNQDVVDAEDDLLAARNELARAVASYRIAILDFRLDTGTLHIMDDGRISTPPQAAPDSAEDANGKHSVIPCLGGMVKDRLETFSPFGRRSRRALTVVPSAARHGQGPPETSSPASQLSSARSLTVPPPWERVH